MYKAHYNTKAAIGEDLIEIKHKVKYIRINTDRHWKIELTTIKYENIVKTMVDDILSADIFGQKNYDLNGTRYSIAFH